MDLLDVGCCKRYLLSMGDIEYIPLEEVGGMDAQARYPDKYVLEPCSVLWLAYEDLRQHGLDCPVSWLHPEKWLTRAAFIPSQERV